MSDPVVATHGLTKRYEQLLAVDRLDLEVRPGEVFGLLGPNGAGKTTTILMLLGLSEPTRGRATVLGLDPTRHPLEVKRRVGYLPDEVGFYGGLTGRQNLRYTARLNGLPEKAAEERIGALLGQVGLAEAADRAVDGYSRGMRQRLGLADALVKAPSVLILDEPTTAVDPAGVVEILALIRTLATQEGTSILLASHLLHQVQQVCDRIGIFVSGRMMAHGTVAELAERMGSEEVTLEVGLAAEPAAAAAALRGLPDVTSVEPDARDPRLWHVTGKRGVRDRLARELTAQGHDLWHLRRVGDDLDEIYLRYFTSQEAPVQRTSGGRTRRARPGRGEGHSDGAAA